MKIKELKSMNNLELENKKLELKKDLMKINSQIAVGTVPKNPGRVKQIKRTIAQILTLNNINSKKDMLPAKKVAMLYKAEEDFKKELLKQLKEKLQNIEEEIIQEFNIKWE